MSDIVKRQKLQVPNRIEVVGELIWIGDTVFYCKNCDKQGLPNVGRYDYAIVFRNDYDNTIRCRKCNTIVTLDKQRSILGGRICPLAWEE